MLVTHGSFQNVYEACPCLLEKHERNETVLAEKDVFYARLVASSAFLLVFSTDERSGRTILLIEVLESES